ncbi:MAG: AI-2E family transporter [Puniceicoccaceae bacterium]
MTPRLLSRAVVDALIIFTIIFLMAFYCVRVFSPFSGIMLWALILAVALYPVHQKIAARLGNRQGRTSTLMAIVAVLGVGAPLFFLSTAFIGQAGALQAAFENNTIEVEPPEPEVEQWPLIGEKVYAVWSAAAESMSEFLQDYNTQIRDLSKWLFSAAASALGAVLQMLVSFIIAAVMMAYGASGSAALGRIFKRMAGMERGLKLQKLCTATIRSVAVGVLGVAFIQALLFGVGFIIGGIPAAGILALIALFLGIVQIPALLVGLPAIAYLWAVGDASPVLNAVLTVYFIAASLADNILKPMLLGRGVEAPMPVILLGALGGMIVSGFIGLFIGAVVLAIGYVVFMAWVDEVDVDEPAKLQSDEAGQ